MPTFEHKFTGIRKTIFNLKSHILPLETTTKPLLASTSAPARLLIFTGIFLISLALTFIVGILLLKPLFGVDLLMLPKLISDFENPLALDVLKFLQLLQGLIAFILPPFLMAWLVERRAAHYLKIDKSPSFTSCLFVIILSVCAIPLINAMGDFNSKMVLPDFMKGIEQWMRDSEDKAAKLTAAFLDMKSFPAFLYIFTMVAILPAIGEELVFRGIIQRFFKDWMGNVHVAIFITAFLFSAIHMQFFGFLPRFMLGLMLGYLFEWSGSLWLNILAHFINNGLAVVFAYLTQKKMMAFDPDKLGVEGHTTLFISASVVIVTVLLFAIHKREKVAHVVA